MTTERIKELEKEGFKIFKFSSGTILLGNYTGGKKDVIVPKGVTSIGYADGRYPFEQQGLTSVVIPESVITILTNAFLYNSSLISITIEGDKTRFNSNWHKIGFPIELKPEEES